MKRKDSKTETKYRAEDLLDLPRNEGVERPDEILEHPDLPRRALPGRMSMILYADDVARARNIHKKEDELMKDAPVLQVDPKLKDKSFNELFPRDRPWDPAKVAEDREDNGQRTGKNSKRMRRK